MEWLTNILSSSNASGIWALFGSITASIITLLGVFANNFFEDSRKLKERHRTIIFDAYTGALQSIAISNMKVMQIVASKPCDKSVNDYLLAEKLYNLSLVASPEVIKSFFNISAKFSSGFAILSTKDLDIKEYSGEIESLNNLMKMASDKVEESLADMKSYNSHGSNNPELFKNYQAQFDVYSSDRDQYLKDLDKVQSKNAQAQISILREAIRILDEITPYIFDLIIIMRKDIEKKLKKKDTQKIKDHFEVTSKIVSSDMEQFMKVLDLKITKLMESTE
jgi:hypothetical protein